MTLTMADNGIGLEGLRVLVVDDNWFARQLIRNVLQAFGIWYIVETRFPLKSLDLLAEYLFDLVLVDHRMPALTGTQFTERVRGGSTCAKANIPIIVVSANTKKACVLNALAAGAQGYLAKPFTAKHLYQRILSVVGAPNDNGPVSRAA